MQGRLFFGFDKDLLEHDVQRSADAVGLRSRWRAKRENGVLDGTCGQIEVYKTLDLWLQTDALCLACHDGQLVHHLRRRFIGKMKVSASRRVVELNRIVVAEGTNSALRRGQQADERRRDDEDLFGRLVGCR